MSVSVIQSELSALSVKELRERAATIGVDDDAIEGLPPPGTDNTFVIFTDKLKCPQKMAKRWR